MDGPPVGVSCVSIKLRHSPTYHCISRISLSEIYSFPDRILSIISFLSAWSSAQRVSMIFCIF